MKTTPSFRSLALVSVLSLGILALPPPATATDTGQGSGKSEKKQQPADHAKPAKGSQAGRARAVPHDVVIDQDAHRRVVREFLTNDTLPPGLAKRESLPPGLSKQLRENGRLPPGLELTTVPPALASRLPAVPGYYSRSFSGRDLIIVNTRTNRIVSVIRDILPAGS